MDNHLNYRPRVADRLLLDQLDAAGAVLIQGPKWCGMRCSDTLTKWQLWTCRNKTRR